MTIARSFTLVRVRNDAAFVKTLSNQGQVHLRDNYVGEIRVCYMFAKSSDVHPTKFCQDRSPQKSPQHLLPTIDP